ncbi:MAG: S9 family peptidase [Deltaproteobacteria bacterium]|nr:S9 family peptidase [Deltaproteobacteria bacterium]
MTTAEGDDRVVPAHAYKFMAEVQQADDGEHPLLLRVEGKAGHGHGKPITKQIDEYADLYSFLFQVLDMRF